MKISTWMTTALLAAALATPRLAHADEVSGYKAMLARHAWVYTGDPDRTVYLDSDHVQKCLAAYDWLHAHSVPDTDTVELDTSPAWEKYLLPRGTHTIGEVHAFCQKMYVKLDTSSAAGTCLDDAEGRDAPATSETVKEGNWRKGDGDALAAKGRELLAEIDAGIKAGVSPTETISYRDHDVTIGDARKRCEAFIEWSLEAEKTIEATIKAEQERVMKRYASAGIAGEKLKLFIDNDGDYWRAVPGCEATDDPRRLAKAKVLYQWVDNADGSITLRKYQFSGNKIAKVTDRIFDTPERAFNGCK